MTDLEYTEDLERLIIQAYEGDKEAVEQLNKLIPQEKGGKHINKIKEF